MHPQNHQKGLLRDRTSPDLFWSEKPGQAVLTIVTVLATKTIMDMKINISFFGIEPGIKYKERVPG